MSLVLQATGPEAVVPEATALAEVSWDEKNRELDICEACIISAVTTAQAAYISCVEGETCQMPHVPANFNGPQGYFAHLQKDLEASVEALVRSREEHQVPTQKGSLRALCGQLFATLDPQ